MNLKNRPPVFVPAEHRAEVEQLSKAALMDMAWDYAKQLAGPASTIDEFRARRDIILAHRNQD